MIRWARHIDLLIAQANRLTSRAQNKVSKQQAVAPRLPDRDWLLGPIAQAAAAAIPDGRVPEAIYPIVAEATLIGVGGGT